MWRPFFYFTPTIIHFIFLVLRREVKITVRNLSYNIEKTGTYRSAFLSL